MTFKKVIRYPVSWGWEERQKLSGRDFEVKRETDGQADVQLEKWMHRLATASGRGAGFGGG
jgi:hypothetical protein